MHVQRGSNFGTGHLTAERNHQSAGIGAVRGALRRSIAG
jgi:hypothetical protein